MTIGFAIRELRWLLFTGHLLFYEISPLLWSILITCCKYLSGQPPIWEMIFFSKNCNCIYAFIFKKGDKNNLTIYQPISVVFAFSKIYETVINTNVIHSLIPFSILSTNQYRFLFNKSTALFNYSTTIYSRLGKNLVFLGTFINFSRAFGLVKHDIMVHKLLKYGVRKQTNQWLKS